VQAQSQQEVDEYSRRVGPLKAAPGRHISFSQWCGPIRSKRCAAYTQIRKYHPKNRGMQPQAIKTRNRLQNEPMAEIESGKTYSGIKFKGLNSWVTEVLQSVLNNK
jgi:hypothetical protein